MSGIIYYLLGCYGLTTIIVQSKIMKPFREMFKDTVPFMYALLNCMMCTGFWVGILISTGFKYSIAYSIFSNGQTNIFELFAYSIFDGGFVSGIMYLMFLIQLNLERHVKDEI
jgi:hypothetical protein